MEYQDEASKTPQTNDDAPTFSTINPKLKFNKICWLTAHNAFASSPYGWIYCQQTLKIEEQLALGVRAFMIDVYDYNDDIYLFHGGAGKTRLQKPFGAFQTLDWFLAKIKTWMVTHPHDIITLILESYLDKGGKKLAGKFNKHGLSEMLYNPPRKELLKSKWDTVEDMIDNGTRLVVISRKSSDGVIHANGVVVENHWDYDNNPNGDVFYADEGSLFIFNHFKPVSLFPATYSLFNTNKSIRRRIANASDKIDGKAPNYIAVDFVQYGSTASIIADLNAAIN